MPTETFFNLPEDKRRLILDLALEEFAENDYRNASISRVVARAGIAKGSFYQYFADKRDLYLYLLQLALAEKKAFLAHAAPPDSGADFFTMLRWMFRAGLGFEFSNPRLAQISYRAVYGDAPLPDETAALLRNGAVGFFRPLVVRGMAAGDIDATLDPDLVAAIAYGLTNQLGDLLLQRLAITPEELASGGAPALDQPDYWSLVDDTIRILERGLRPALPAAATEPQHETTQL